VARGGGEGRGEGKRSTQRSQRVERKGHKGKYFLVIKTSLGREKDYSGQNAPGQAQRAPRMEIKARIKTMQVPPEASGKKRL
jgi:hypothetical protein